MTQTRKDALQELLAKVEACGKIQPFLFQDAFNNQNHVNCAGEAYDAYSGSLDAALALHNAVLPGWSWVKPDGPEMGSIRVFGPDNGDFYPSAIGKASNTARAWLCAILKALIAECDE